ncbi:MAG: YodC family protein [Pseudoalteromonas sp.]|jgi:uncharacterized protein YodC (DUF2158 family)|uniref:YodC family protein n=1 Tax=Pseudoalteromonas TaxID=53246 RepID=UPI001787CA95|nr:MULTISPECIES: YodC family protein [Pseudoalteromonas]MBE0422112.1 YodC family protein [Pseudoalteromonas nigrifaciens]MBH0073251.1 YodC family protein [Pseudoalteromonas sp. NZS127]
MTKNANFEVGDIVKIKSGGPEMTVRSVPSQHAAYYICQWFAGKKLEQGNFPNDSLESVDKS